jgi:hypothetical protein
MVVLHGHLDNRGDDDDREDRVERPVEDPVHHVLLCRGGRNVTAGDDRAGAIVDQQEPAGVAIAHEATVEGVERAEVRLRGGDHAEVADPTGLAKLDAEAGW